MKLQCIKIKNWDRWQSYRSDRGQPPWIKIHRRLMRNVEWVSLSDAERGQLVAMWLLAADHDGVIPASPEIIQKLCFMSEIPDINKFTDLGFIENGWRQLDVTMAPERRQHVAPEAEKNKEVKNKEVKKNIYLDCVKLTNEEYQKLINRFGERETKKRIDTLNNYVMSKGKKYKSHYHTILSWENLRGEKGKDGLERFLDRHKAIS